jgi:hypothetical protein
MDDGHYISETIHKRHALKFWIKMWCLSHLRDCSKLIVMTLNPFMTQQPFGIASSKEEASRKVRKKSSTIGFGFDEVTVPRSVLSPPSDLKRTVQIVLNFNNIH